MTQRDINGLINNALANASTTREVLVEPGMLARVGEFVSRAYPERKPIIVADENTYRIAGEAVMSSLRDAGLAPSDPVVFQGHPTLKPDIRYVEGICHSYAPDSLPIAVGSGTINDLTKRSAFEAGLPYIVVGTAPSMDGYTASGAALIADGVKQTFECPAPEAVLADLDVLRNAPPAMIASGYGDLIGKITAGADWILADALGIEPIIPDVWEMVQGPLREMVADPARLFAGDAVAIEHLFQGLVITGLAIQVAGTTRTASGSEHQFSHLWEMRGLEHNGEVVSHGKKVALGTIVSETLYDRLLAYPIETLDVEAAVSSWLSWEAYERRIRATHDHPKVVEKALEECRAKYMSSDELRGRLLRLKERWDVLAPGLHRQLLPLRELNDLLTIAQCPTHPRDIGLSLDQMRASYLAAGQIRRRYTVFDILFEAGLLDEIVDDLFAPGGYWAADESRGQG